MQEGDVGVYTTSEPDNSYLLLESDCVRGTAVTQDRFGLELSKSSLINAPWSHIPKGMCIHSSLHPAGAEVRSLPRSSGWWVLRHSSGPVTHPTACP